MRYHLHFTYWILLTITILSSCFLFLVVAAENAKYVPATTTTTTTTTPAETVAAELAAAPAATHETPKVRKDFINVDAAELPKFVDKHNEKAEVLPNYKKVKKLTTPPPAATTVPAALTKTTAESNLENNHLKEAPALETNSMQDNVQHQLIDDNTFDLLAMHAEGANDDEVIQKVPKTNEERNVLDDSSSTVVDDTEEQELYKKTDEIADKQNNDLPDIITEIPTVTVTELPIEFLEPTLMPLDTVILDASNENKQEQENKTFKIIELTNNDGIKKDDQIVKINDSGGGGVDLTDELQQIQENSIKSDDSNIPVNDNQTTDTATRTTTTTITADINDTQQQQQGENQQQQQQQQQHQQQNATKNNLNLTAEEVPIPVFSEWAQKQMEAAEKQEALEQEQQVVNNSAQRRNQTNGNGKPALHKIRSKNYASPDCGAKIIASNADATNTGAVLSSSKDEYMLSPCGNRIWFVVELCEAIQAQKVDLANFELFSSSPKNFTVAVSNRFPTRDWSNVGRFIAEDKRTVQSFDLHPHLFGKFVRVDIHTHYSKEHFCPVSLFRVFGTSEFEAFETENDPNDDLDDFDEEFAMEQARAKNSENNLFKSASDAVLSMVKKAAEVLAKPTATKEKNPATIAMLCQTPVFGTFSCVECNQTIVERINSLLSCEVRSLLSLLHNTHLQKDLKQTRICQKDFGIDTKLAAQQTDCSLLTLNSSFEVDAKSSYFLNLLPLDYVGALCQLLVEQQNLRKTQNITGSSNQVADANAQALNLTIDKKVRDNFQINMTQEKKLIATEIPAMPKKQTTDNQLAGEKTTTATPIVTTETTIKDTEEQIVRPPVVTEETPTTPVVSTTAPTTTADAEKSAPDVNIFNVPEVDKPELIPATQTTTTTSDQLQAVNVEDSSSEQQPSIASTIAAGGITSTEANNMKIDEDPSSWESLDNLLTSTVPTTVATGGSATTGGAAAAGSPPNTNGVNLQQKLPTGGPQSESVFIRLSNRIKALERNMSLSGQYLEELSRRYKKQVEELHQILTQQTQNVRTLEEQSRRHSAVEQIYAQRNTQLKDELEDLRLQIHACVVVIIFVGGFLFLVLIIGILFYRSIYRNTKSLLAGNAVLLTSRHDINNSKTNAQKKVKRRKSFEDFSEQERLKNVLACTGSNGVAAGNGEKERRPSEEAMLILKHCALDEPQRQRKLSVFYGSGDQLIDTKITNTKQSKRKGEKHSWPSTQQAHQQAQQHRVGSEASVLSLPRVRLQIESTKAVKTKKKTQQLYKRQESAPTSTYVLAECLNSSAPNDASNAISDYDESLLLDEDDLDNFLPNADLVYNEFMPEGPSGYQIATEAAQHLLDEQQQQQQYKPNKSTPAGNKKSRRLSSPAFFKSAFGKSLKIKPKQHTPPHESTSWEWYRLRKSDAQQNKSATKRATAAASNVTATATTSLDNTSLSEINFPTNSTQNSFRILEEAILMSGEASAAAGTAINKSTAAATSGVVELTTNGKRKSGGLALLKNTTTNNNNNSNNNNINSNSNSSGNGCASSSSSCSISSASNSSRNRSCNGSCSNPSSTSSSCSNSTKNSKNRSFNKIFRKVF